ncbi:MAG TPA: Nif3-like dinuclear metal center hexameric protein [Planctomycetaceae bacterium]
MPRVADVAEFLDAFAPATLAESWDNVGLLLGDRSAELAAVMTCLTLTPDVAAEAIRERAGLVVTHHPILFRPVKRLTTDTPEGATLLALAKAGVAVYSPHTAFDGAADGVNARICERLGLTNVHPIRPLAGPVAAAEPLDARPIGAGRYGALPESLDFTAFAGRVRAAFGLRVLEAVPSPGPVSKVAVACGAAAEFLSDAIAAGCEALVTGEARFHAAVEARTRGVGLVLLGHYVSERFAVEDLAAVIARRFPDLRAWPSRDERDPIERFWPESGSGGV